MNTKSARWFGATAFVIALTAGLSSCSGFQPEAARTKASAPSSSIASPSPDLGSSDVSSHSQPVTSTPLGDTPQTWPALDRGAQPGALGTVTPQGPGVYRYEVVGDDTVTGLQERFHLCSIDIGNSLAGASNLQPGQILTIKRRMTDPSGQKSDPSFHRGWKCTYPDPPRTLR